MKKNNNLPSKLFYGIGSLGYSTVSQTEANLIMFFGTAILGLPGVLTGILVAISVCWDALSDPIVGHWTDHSQNKVLGKRHGFILLGVIGMSVCNLFLWQIDASLPMFAKAGLLFLMIMLLETCNTLFASPHGALGVEMSTDEHDRTKTLSVKVVFFLIGMLLPSVLMMIFANQTGIDAQISGEQLVSMGYAISVICLVCGLVCFFGTLKHVNRNIVASQPVKAKKSLKHIFQSFFLVFSSREKRSVILGYSTSQMASAFLTASGLHMFTFSFHFSSFQISILMLAVFGNAILSQPFWLKLSKKRGKQKTLITATQVSIVGTLLLALVYVFSREILHLSFAFGLVSLCVCGFGIGALFSLPISIYSDMIMAKQESSSNCATELGFLNLAFKFAGAVGLVFVGALLDIVKFNPNMPVQTLEVQHNLAMIVLSGIIGSFVLSIALYRTGRQKTHSATVLSSKKGRTWNEVKTN